VEITSIEEVPPSETSRKVLMPIVDQVGGLSEPAQVNIGRDVWLTPELERELSAELGIGSEELTAQLGSEIHIVNAEDLPADGDAGDSGIAEFASYRDSLSADVVRASLGKDSLSSSVLGGPDLYEVNDISRERAGATRISVGRLGLHEFQVELPAEAAHQVEVGEAVLGAERLYSKRKLFGFGRVTVEFVPDAEQPPPLEIWLPLIRLHCPRKKGCKATYLSASTTEEEVEASLTITGIGGGGGIKVSGTFAREYTTEEKCLEMVMPAMLHLLVGKTTVDGTEVAYGMRAKVVDPRPTDKKLRLLPRASDSCQRPRNAIGDLPRRDALDATEAPKGEYWNSITLRREVHGKLTVGLEFGKAPVKFGIDYMRTSSKETTIKTLLRPGARYLAYAPNHDAGPTLEQQLEICWTTKP
jgi:hypothetical protein